MGKTIISLRDEKSVSIVKEAKKKAIDCGFSFSDATLQLLEKWVSNEVKLAPKEARK